MKIQFAKFALLGVLSACLSLCSVQTLADTCREVSSTNTLACGYGEYYKYKDPISIWCCECPKGSYCPTYTDRLYTCPEGFYCPAKTADPRICRPGTYTRPGEEECHQCPAGQYSNFDGVWEYYNNYYADVMRTLQTCHDSDSSAPADLKEYVRSKSGQGEYCEYGTYTDYWGKTQDTCYQKWISLYTVCLECPANTYSKPGATSCIGCGANSSSSAGASTCTCNDGYYKQSGSEECESCPAGSYCKGGTKTSCGSSQWSFAASTQSSDCKTCPSGSSVNATKDGCNCSNGKVFDSATNTCTTCTEGPVVDGQCTTCEPGKYWVPAEASKGCQECPAGYACSGGTNKTACEGNTYSGKGRPSCDTCNGITDHITCEAYVNACPVPALIGGADCTVYSQMVGGCCPSGYSCLPFGTAGRYACQQVAPTTCPATLIAKDASCADYTGLPNNCCATGLTCTGGKCVCGTKPGFNNACTTDCGCQDGFICTEGVCKCPTGKNYDSATNTCLSTASCPTPLVAKDASCVDYAGKGLANDCCATGLTCTGGKCVCGTKPGFNNACTATCGCQDGFTCTEGVCKCPAGTDYDSKTNTCLSTASCPATPLVVDSDCSGYVGKGLANDCCPTDLTCTGGKCVCGTIPNEYNATCNLTCGCSGGYTCTDTKCKCPSNKKYDEESNSCVNKEDTSCDGMTCGDCQVCDQGSCVTDTTKEGSAVGECGVCRGGSVQKDSSKETDCKTCNTTDWKLVLKDVGTSCGQCKECTSSGDCQTVGTVCGTSCCAEGQTCRDNQCQGNVTTCDPGKYVKDNQCESCPAGSYCRDGKKTLCPDHQYSPSGASECIECQGTVNADHTQCSKCGAGLYWKNNSCATCEGNVNDAHTTCTPCGEGQYWHNNACTPCEGDVNDAHTTCKPCGEGYKYHSTSHRCEAITCESEPVKKCLQGSTCVCCAPKTLFDGSQCVCPADTIEIDGGCQQKPASCPAPLLDKGTSCALYEGKSNNCCAAGLSCTSGTCQCPSSLPNSYRAACHSGCGCSGDFDCKNGQCVCLEGKEYDSKTRKCVDACKPGEYRENGNIVICPAGSYCPGDGNIHLTPVGTYTPAGADKSVPCEAGTYSDTEGATACTSCPEGTYSAKEGATSCTPCSKGTYNDKTKAASCTLCPEGTYSDTEGATACSPCLAGSYSANKGSASCSLCPMGYYNTAEGLTKCEACAQNTYADKEGSTSCKACSEGKVSSVAAASCRWKCRAGYYFDGTECVKCLAGSFCSGDETSQLCPAGWFSVKDQSTSCTKCPAGSYASKSGMTSCVLCPERTFSAKEGATSCEKCPSGTTSSLGATECVESYQCHDGEYLYMNECIECPEGSYCVGDKKITCPMGHRCPSGATEPVECEAGRYSDRTGTSRCTLCGKGSISKQGSANCTKCTTGPSNDEHTRCVACEKGKYYDGSRCVACPANATCSGGVINCDVNYTRVGTTCVISLRRK